MFGDNGKCADIRADAGRFALMGDSAGGNLAIAACFTFGQKSISRLSRCSIPSPISVPMPGSPITADRTGNTPPTIIWNGQRWSIFTAPISEQT
jgi:hypothetical protein